MPREGREDVPAHRPVRVLLEPHTAAPRRRVGTWRTDSQRARSRNTGPSVKGGHAKNELQAGAKRAKLLTNAHILGTTTRVRRNDDDDSDGDGSDHKSPGREHGNSNQS